MPHTSALFAQTVLDILNMKDYIFITHTASWSIKATLEVTCADLSIRQEGRVVVVV